ncbi:MAG: hypothetical protein AAGJ18_29345, partial [Bacteroidota bacterium]
MNKIFFFLLLFLPILGQSQISKEQQAKIEALNNYLHFSNESKHGLMIVHRLLETFNQRVNKYVDLESNQLNFYSNADLPQNIFVDEEHWFYDVSPYVWYDKAMAASKKLPATTAAQLQNEADKMKRIITRINTIRFELDDLTEGKDLKQRKNLPKIYQTLEACVTLYDDFNVAKRRLKNAAKKGFAALNIANDNKALGNIIAIHENIRAFLEGVRAEDSKNMMALTQHIENNLATAESFNIPDRTYANILQKAEAFAKVAQKYLDGVAFPTEYKLYGNAYYYYNVEMVAKFNRYGSGLVHDLNRWVADKQYPALVQLEEPHFFKVIYPKKEVPKVAEIATVKPNKIPQNLDNRAVVIKQKKIQVSPGTITIEVYDHQLADGDIISLNYNGHWILKDYPLRRRARKLT